MTKKKKSPETDPKETEIYKLPNKEFKIIMGASLVAQPVKESACNAGDLGSIPGLGRSPGEGKGYPLQNSGQENSMDYIVYGVVKSQTRLSDFYFLTLGTET